MNPKLATLAAWSIGGIVLPIALPMPLPLAAISTGTATAMAYALSQEAKVGAVRTEIQRQRRENRLDRLITAEEYAHQAAMSRLEALYFSPVPQPPAALPGAHPAQPVLPVSAPAAVPFSPPLGEEDFYIPLPPVETVETVETRPQSPTALDQILASPYESRFIPGAQRAGKSLLAAVAARKLQSTRGTKIFHINLASYGDEDQRYWHTATRSLTGNLTTDPSDRIPHLLGKAIEIVDQFLQTPESLLIIDEWTILCSLFNPHAKMVSQLTRRLAGIISGLSSSGKKQRRALWALSPELVATTLTPEGKAIKTLRLCYVAINPGAYVTWQGDRVEFSTELHKQLKANYEGVEMPPPMSSERICQINGIWYPIGVSEADLTPKTKILNLI